MNDTLTRVYVEKVEYQTRKINNLKRWMRYVLLTRSLSFFMIVSPVQLRLWIRFIFVIVMAINVLAAVLIGWAIRNGTSNVSSLLERMNR